MRTKCLTSEQISLFISNKLLPKDKKEIDKHLENCPICKTLIKYSLKGQPKEIVKNISEVKELLSQPKPSRKTKGQIWRLQFDENYGKNAIGIITSVKKDTCDLVFVNFDITEEQAYSKDIVLETRESPLKLRYVVETWNNRNIMNSKFMNYLGDISDLAYEKIEKALTLEESKIPLVVKKFRELRNKQCSTLGNIAKLSGNTKPIPDKLLSKLKEFFNTIFVIEPIPAAASSQDLNKQILKNIVKSLKQQQDKNVFSISYSSDEADIILKTDEVKGISFYHSETNEIMKTIYADENNVITLRYKDFDGLTSKLNAKFIEK